MWLGLFIILLIIEVVTTGLVTIWFALGALAAFVASLITDSVIIQTVVFFVVSILTLIFTRPILNKYIKPNIQDLNLNLKGKTGLVTEDIEDLKPGEVKVEGKHWTAKSKETIKKGSKVEILSIEGVKLIVKKKED